MLWIEADQAMTLFSGSNRRRHHVLTAQLRIVFTSEGEASAGNLNMERKSSIVNRVPRV
jgi:hypothetical protein